MNTIWLDVTITLRWERGTAVGIVRTESECAAHALNLVEKGIDIKFCRFSTTKGFEVVEKDLICKAIQKIAGIKPENEHVTSKLEITSQFKLQKGLKSLLLKVVNTLPASLRKPAFIFLKKRKPAVMLGLSAFFQFWQSIKEFVNPSIILPDEELLSLSNVPFKPGDKYIFLSLDLERKLFYYLQQLKKQLDMKVLSLCYDLIPVKFPHLCAANVFPRMSEYFIQMADCADKILCISECSKLDLQNFLLDMGKVLPKMSTIKLGCELPKVHTSISSPEVTRLLQQKYILFVSSIDRRKNHETLYRAYLKLLDQGIRNLPILVFVGVPYGGVNDFLLDLQLDPRIRGLTCILDKVSDSDLVRLYQGTLFTVYPSLYEGWGLPITESLAAGKFCIASNVASIPEAGQNYIDYLDPWDVSAWAERLNWYIQHPEEILAKELVIKSNYKPYAWKDSADSIFKEAISEI